jgi:hypothetical protein
MRGNPDNLRKAATRKSAATHARAEQGLIQMLREGRPITFRGLAQTAGVSLDFLYHHDDIRQRVEHLRTQQQTRSERSVRVSDPDHPSSVVRTLTAQLAELKRRHHQETQELKQALEAAHGENLQLRRRLTAAATTRDHNTGPHRESLPDAYADAQPAQTPE